MADPAPGPSDAQRRVIAASEQALARVRFAVDPRGVRAHLRLCSDGRERDVLLGDTGRVEAPVPVVQWDTAPIAAVLFEARPGDPYTIEQGERTLEGELVMRTLLTVDEHGLAQVATDEWTARRDGEGGAGAWRIVADARPRWAERTTAARRRRPSPLVVDLDAAQRAAVDLPSDRSVLLLGDAGYGKTTVALHRAAKLAADARASGRAFSAVVIVPTRGLARLCRLALDRLDASDVQAFTFSQWIADQARAVFAGIPEREADGTGVVTMRLKRHPALQGVLPWIASGTPAMKELKEVRPRAPANRRDLLHIFGDRAVLERVVAESGGALGVRAIEETLSHTRVQFSPRTEHAHRDVDADRLATLDSRPIDEGTPMHDAETIDVEDYAVLFELNHLKVGRDEGPRGALSQYHHIVLDEAQELAPIELSVLARACAPGGSVTVAGDAQQRTDPTSFFGGWDRVVGTLAPRGHEVVRLTESYRCPPAVETFARALFTAPASTLPAGDPALIATRFDAELHLLATIVDVLVERRTDDPTATLVVIARTAAAARRLHGVVGEPLGAHLALHGDVRFRAGIQITSVEEARGLEFDYVVIPDAGPIAYPGTEDGRRALYVAVTRAIHGVWLCTAGPWSPIVRPAP
jgi:DNA helicase II / ATP-dependent DNA helicase PcrA